MTSLLTSIVVLFHLQSASTLHHISTNEIWTTLGETYHRPSWSGTVDITYDDTQIRKVVGIVLPISSTGRPAPPRPYNGYPTGDDIELDKGHIMAISNGGPNIKLNIVPQDSQWQETGGWRDFEEVIFQHALYKYGWDPTSLYEASQIARVHDPEIYVKYTVSLYDYSSKTGEPMRYEGTVHTGSTYYHFTIKPDTGVRWKDGRAPPTLKSVKVGAVEGERSLTSEPWMTGTMDIFTSDIDDHDDGRGWRYAVKEFSYIGIGVFLLCIVTGLSYCIYRIFRQQRKGSPSDLAPYEQFL